ncbi:MAG: AAA family ATPase [Clostridiales Family XIII bacterium]|jgi:ATP-dependent Zn protease|nr:AAA family ATPase [Clostridiales Family XIII bacterium]
MKEKKEKCGDGFVIAAYIILMIILNAAMRFVMLRAKAEADAVNASTIWKEHLFLGLLKLAELDADAISPASTHKKDINDDIQNIKVILRSKRIETAGTRALLRRILIDAVYLYSIRPNHEVSDLMQEAKTRSPNYPAEYVTASCVLNLLLENPTPILKELLELVAKSSFRQVGLREVAHVIRNAPEVGFYVSNQLDSDRNNVGFQEAPKGKAFLAELTERINKMRYSLLSSVYGQDHAVHSFAEGMFSAEVLADADSARRQPRAIFVFAGAPGVGKTFLAEQAASTLKILFKRYDMSGYSDHQQHISLVGFAPSYKDAKEGVLTGFVRRHPHSILLFDEIEKAHINTIHLFLQILDSGELHDDFLDKDVSFKDTIIIFTTNAGKQLYDGDHKQNAAGLPRHTIINALETDINPETSQPFFPPTICSRLATGWPLMFNRLQAHDLEKIGACEFERCCSLFEKQYGIPAKAEGNLLPSALLFAEGGLTDARTIRAQTELFFKNEIFGLNRLYAGERLENALQNLESLNFNVEAGDLSPHVSALFTNSDNTRILVYSDNSTAERISRSLPDFVIYRTEDREEAFRIAGEQDIDFVLLELSPGFEDELFEKNGGFTFDHVPIGADSLQEPRRFFREFHERLPELPVYLLESGSFTIDNELLTSFIRGGARGKLAMKSSDLSVFSEEITSIAKQLHLQRAASLLASEHKMLHYETTPFISPDRRHVTICVRDLSIKRSPYADDTGELLDDAERPNVRFSDVIGAKDAKDELAFFVEYLKNPKKFKARGLNPPKGVLLYGPPGTGKTLLARAMAGESDAAFIPSTATAFVTKYQGSGPEAVRELFKRARRYAPSIVFIDEIDAIGRARGGGESAHGEEMALNALFTEIDGFGTDVKSPVFVLAATNFEVEAGKYGKGFIDPALTRRFDRKILVDMPTKDDRLTYMQSMFDKRKWHNVSANMIEQLAKRSTGLSLSALETVIELAFRNSVKAGHALDDELFEEAFEISRHGDKKDWGAEYMERVARHEAGHAYMCFSAGRTPAYLTIVARGNHGGYMEPESDEDEPIKTRDDLLERIRTALGGRAAEIAYYGEHSGISSGAAGDLENATRIARSMICSYGMDEVIGPAVINYEDALKGALAAKITNRISDIIQAELLTTTVAIENAVPKIDLIVERLLEKNRLDRDEIDAILTPPTMTLD